MKAVLVCALVANVHSSSNAVRIVESTTCTRAGAVSDAQSACGSSAVACHRNFSGTAGTCTVVLSNALSKCEFEDCQSVQSSFHNVGTETVALCDALQLCGVRATPFVQTTDCILHNQTVVACGEYATHVDYDSILLRMSFHTDDKLRVVLLRCLWATNFLRRH